MIKAALILLNIAVQVFCVEKCYYCTETCAQSIIEQNCKESASDTTEIDCYSLATVTDSGVSALAKGCLPREESEKACRQASLDPNSICYVCDGDLCNDSNKKTSAAESASPITILAVSTIIFTICTQ